MENSAGQTHGLETQAETMVHRSWTGEHDSFSRDLSPFPPKAFSGGAEAHPTSWSVSFFTFWFNVIHTSNTIFRTLE